MRKMFQNEEGSVWNTSQYKPEMFPVAVCYQVPQPTVCDLVCHDKCQRTIASLQTTFRSLQCHQSQHDTINVSSYTYTVNENYCQCITEVTILC